MNSCSKGQIQTQWDTFDEAAALMTEPTHWFPMMFSTISVHLCGYKMKTIDDKKNTTSGEM